jgi:hypothetical protein
MTYVARPTLLQCSDFLEEPVFFPSLLTSQTPVAYGEEYLFMLNVHMLHIGRSRSFLLF